MLALGAVVLAGCGGGKSAQTTTSPPPTVPPPATTTNPPGDPGRAAVEAFVAAARAGRPAALWNLLSTESRRRLGPLAAFRTHTAVELEEGVGSFRRFDVIVSERITPEFGVVAIDGTRVAEGSRERSVYAVPLRLEGSSWRIELGGPVKVRPIGPDPGARQKVVAQIAAAVEGPGGTGTAVLYLDGSAETPEVRGTPTNSTLFANFDPALEPGRHTVVVFAADGREAAATAWAFTVAKR